MPPPIREFPNSLKLRQQGLRITNKERHTCWIRMHGLWRWLPTENASLKMDHPALIYWLRLLNRSAITFRKTIMMTETLALFLIFRLIRIGTLAFCASVPTCFTIMTLIFPKRIKRAFRMSIPELLIFMIPLLKIPKV